MKSVRKIFVPLLILCALFTLGCSGSGKADSQQEKEQSFKKAFGFPPPANVSDILFEWISGRGFVDGSLTEWMRFTAPPSVLTQIIEKRGFSEETRLLIPNPSSHDPKWWSSPAKGARLYVRTEKDTTADEGFPFIEKIWADPATGLIYYSRECWD